MLDITTLPSSPEGGTPPRQQTTYQHQNVWHNNVLVLCAIGQVWLEEKSSVLQVGNSVIVVERDVCFIPVLPAKRWDTMGTILRQSPCSLWGKDGLHRPGLAAGGEKTPGEAAWKQIETSHPSQD